MRRTIVVLTPEERGRGLTSEEEEKEETKRKGEQGRLRKEAAGAIMRTSTSHGQRDEEDGDSQGEDEARPVDVKGSCSVTRRNEGGNRGGPTGSAAVTVVAVLMMLVMRRTRCPRRLKSTTNGRRKRACFVAFSTSLRSSRISAVFLVLLLHSSDPQAWIGCRISVADGPPGLRRPAMREETSQEKGQR